MAKADFNRDYYADLELPPTADVADVKKQFRKLGLFTTHLPLPFFAHIIVNVTSNSFPFSSAQISPRPQSRQGG